MKSPAFTPGDAFQLADRLGHAAALLQSAADELVEDEEVSSAELVAMFVLLAFDGGISQTEWGRLQGVSRQRAHVVTRTLLAHGYIDCRKDGRASVVTLNASGHRVASRLQAKTGHAMHSRLQPIAPDRAHRLNALLGELIDCLS